MAKTEKLLERYECGPFRFADDDYYDRHLVFDHVVPEETASTRDRFEAMARSIRDLLTQRWLLTQRTHDSQDVKEVYYLSMEFLIGRTLANNISNLQVEEFVRNDFASDAGQDWQTLFEQEPDAGLGNGGLGRLAACFLDSLATLQIPAVGYGLRYEYGMFRQETHQRPAGRTPGQLVDTSRPLGGRPAGGVGRRPLELRFPHARRAVDRDARRADHPPWDSL